MFGEFKKFLIQGNMVDMAIGFIFGGAFSTVIKSMVDNVIMPPIGMLLGRVDFSNLFIAIDGNSYASLADAEEAQGVVIKYGAFINDIVSFVILGFVVFLAVRYYNKLKEEPKEEVAAVEESTILLREIRDSLKK